jgi:hypothetical protein
MQRIKPGYGKRTTHHDKQPWLLHNLRKQVEVQHAFPISLQNLKLAF